MVAFAQEGGVLNSCDSAREGSPPPDCRIKAEVIWICRVEGREVTLCGPCDQAWKRMANITPALQQRCPHCASKYHESRQISPSGHSTGPLGGLPIEGPLAEAINRAMLAEGISGDARRRVLTRMAADSDPYIASLLRSVASAGAAA
jgi:hypothetical protein